MKFLLLIIITLFSLFHFHPIKSEPFSCPSVPGPVFFKLAVQWPNSFCDTDHSFLTSCKRPIPQRFIVRGLWAFDGSGKSVPYCDHGTLLSKQEVDYKRYELEHEWPNLLGGHFEIWSKEWKKHGRCLSGMTPKVYFDTAIDIMEEVESLLEVLIGKGLSPDTNQLYPTHDFPRAIQNQIDAITEIKCNTDFHGRSQLQEVVFCASAHGVLLNCSYNTRNVYKSRNCPGNILFPSEPPAPALALPAPTLAISTRLNFRALIIVSLYVFRNDEGGYTIYVTLTSLPK